MRNNPAKAKAVLPTRTPNKTVNLVKCREGYACLDLENFKQLLENANNTETYIEQLQNILSELAEPIQSE